MNNIVVISVSLGGGTPRSEGNEKLVILSLRLIVTFLLAGYLKRILGYEILNNEI